MPKSGTVPQTYFRKIVQEKSLMDVSKYITTIARVTGVEPDFQSLDSEIQKRYSSIMSNFKGGRSADVIGQFARDASLLESATGIISLC